MIYFIRHGLSQANVNNTFAGQKDDSELVEQGIEQAKATGRTILGMNLDIQRIICSPLKRTKRTAQEIAKIIGFDINNLVYDNRLIEYDMGVLTGTPHHDVDSQALISAEGAENSNSFRDRVIACVREYINQPGDTLFISHGGVGRMLETIKESKDPRSFYDTQIWPNASVTKIDWIK
jgi:probable phosphoglycerate mutase